MKNRHGFTLIELLAVIIILGVILFIAVPSMTKAINESKERSAIVSTENYLEAVANELTYDTTSGDVSAYKGTYTINSDGSITSGANTIEISSENEKPIGGTIVIDEEGQIESVQDIETGNYVCNYEGKDITCINRAAVSLTTNHYIISPTGTTLATIYPNELTSTDWWKRIFYHDIAVNYIANQYKLSWTNGATNANTVQISTKKLDHTKYKSITFKGFFYYDGGSYPNAAVFLARSITGTQAGTNWFMPTAAETIKSYQFGSATKTEAYYRTQTGDATWTVTKGREDVNNPCWEERTFDLTDVTEDFYLSMFSNNGYFYIASIEIEQYK